MRHEPTKRSEADLDVRWRAGREPRLNQRLRQARIVVSQNVFKPEPVLALACKKQGHQPVGQQLAEALGRKVSAFQRAIGVQAQEREGPSPRRREILDCWKRSFEKRRSPSAAR